MGTLDNKFSHRKFFTGLCLIVFVVFCNLCATIWGAKLQSQDQPLSAFTIIYFNVTSHYFLRVFLKKKSLLFEVTFDMICFLPAIFLAKQVYSIQTIFKRSVVLTMIYQVGNVKSSFFSLHLFPALNTSNNISGP